MDGQVAARTDETAVGIADPAARISVLLAAQKAAWSTDVTPSHAVRDGRLDRLDRMVVAWEARFAAAISEDFGNRPAVVTTLTDIVPVRAAIRHARRELKRWMRPRRVSLAWTGKPASAQILRQPLGVVGIVAPWNYPLNLMLSPLVGALAAGNRALLKPSELTPAFSEVLAKAVAETFAEDEVAVVTGGPEVATAFTAAPFDHLIFTGSTAVGRKVAEAAARNLTPVTLELGGKSPVILDPSVDLDKAVPRLVWGKLLNSGQTCVAPDYALVPRGRVPDFLAAVKAEVAEQYPGLPGNADYTTIISPRHFDRLVRLVEEARERDAEVVELAGPHDPERRVFSPVAVVGAPDDTGVMAEEIFGPILPVVPYDTLDEAIAYINLRDRPLALYWFGSDKAAEARVLSGTIAGGVTINDTILHLAQDDLPFGGVGASGYGAYHGEAGFLALSKEKPVLRQSVLSGVSLLYPPYGRLATWMLKLLGRLG
ncbi:coniferyl aldehyde dehydrogenase [Rhizobium sp. 'Codium 1']|uniref:coniferyl aldehyde dehydrogenase n=1 Tax=Rhizobium sp. 'Codium 1' TaxID=2940484 RepID=UPI001E33FF58|nr:coniferyl aldehyde dehydrogenase [Rhizobium sp. 'Codium 1']MCC8932160.1 coniferyl aldehyde dehydrogenase [Rhizobium sp. 'Codium 1']